MMLCKICGGELVEVDNPIRREVCHKRGVVCEPDKYKFIPTDEPLELPETRQE